MRCCHLFGQGLLVLVGFHLLLVSGCSTTKFTPVAGLENESVTSRTGPAKVSKESEKSLEKKGYAQIGSVRSDDRVKTCWGDDCNNFTCTPDIPHKDLTKEVVEKAAAHGGDIVVLEKDSAPGIESTTKKGKCISWQTYTYTESQCSGGYGNVPRYCTNVTKQGRSCSAWDTVYGKDCTFVSSGIVWRHDPELAKRLVVISRELREKKRLKDAEREKKETEAKQWKSKIAALDKMYAGDSFMAEKDELVSVKVDGKYGFQDRSGRMIIAPQFTDTRYGFSDGVAVVSVGDKKAEQWGIIDKTGKWIVPPSDKSFKKFSDRMGIIYENKLCGYLNTKGQVVIAPQFGSCSQFTEGFAAVVPASSDKCGYVDKQGRIVIAPQFSLCGSFSEGFAWVRPAGSNKFGYIDKIGTMVIEPQFSGGRVFSEGLAAVEINRKWGYIDKKGNVVIKPQFRTVERFAGGIAKAVGDDYLDVKYIDRLGNILFEPFK
jgi:hypothetical protein